MSAQLDRVFEKIQKDWNSHIDKMIAFNKQTSRVYYWLAAVQFGIAAVMGCVLLWLYFFA